jgi:hypothetical protein
MLHPMEKEKLQELEAKARYIIHLVGSMRHFGRLDDEDLLEVCETAGQIDAVAQTLGSEGSD